ncbi:hypothetical protein AEAC466_09150 [Asticcacaulis sp. AC466]|uniref:hypothetical protein n=1 Tax=Asticcacaulis sp. AC466 TaxID=1282362 RepID=UPI0003C40532|nr:hypothetical protein [Asticcacaulis sp. AC466]ESQ84508.1 hypothetical protein AEAC466_09150 [Asticcacaulis sp. AC466]
MYANIIRLRDRVGGGLEGLAARLTARTTRRTRLVGTTAVVLVMHGLVLWSLILTHPKAWQLDHDMEEPPPVLVELWQAQPPPEPKVQPVVMPREVVPQPRDVPQPMQRDAPRDIPKQTQTPQTQTPQTQAAEAAPPQPVPQPVAPSITLNIPQEKPLVVAAPAVVPDVPAPARIPGRVKKKTQDEVSAKHEDAVTRMSDLNLHDAANVSLPALQAVKPSGLVAAPSAGGRLGSMGAPAGLPSGTGVLKGGRGQVSQALQNHGYCEATRQAGKPIPADCNMTDLAHQPPLGPRPDADLQAAVREKDTRLRYKSSPGNAEYWQRVNRAPTPNDRHMDDEPKKGAYFNEHDQRIMGNGGGTADPKGESNN